MSLSRPTFSIAFVFAFVSLVSSTAFAAEPDALRPAPTATTTRGIASGGISTANLFGVSSTAMHVGLGLGIEHGRFFVPLVLDVALGQTERELSAGEVEIGGGVMGIFGPVRLGGGLDLGYGWIGRAPSSSSPHVGMYGIDAFAQASVDLFDIGERRAVYLAVKPSIGVRWGESIFSWDHGAITWRGAAIAGVRF